MHLGEITLSEDQSAGYDIPFMNTCPLEEGNALENNISLWAKRIYV